MSLDDNGLFIDSQDVRDVACGIAGLLKPERIYLYNRRVNFKNETTSFKLCIIAAVEDKYSSEKDIYLNIDCEVPFDVIIYSPGEWEKLAANPDSFAHKIMSTGMVVYHD